MVADTAAWSETPVTLPSGSSRLAMPRSFWGSFTAAKSTLTSVPWAAFTAAWAAGVDTATIMSTPSSTKPWQISSSFALSPWAFW